MPAESGDTVGDATGFHTTAAAESGGGGAVAVPRSILACSITIEDVLTVSGEEEYRRVVATEISEKVGIVAVLQEDEVVDTSLPKGCMCGGGILVVTIYRCHPRPSPRAISTNRAFVKKDIAFVFAPCRQLSQIAVILFCCCC